MAENATNWVTIKIPEETRDRASKDPRTYEEIMKAGLGKSEVVESDGDLSTADFAATVVDHMNEFEWVAERPENDPDELANAVWRKADYAEIGEQVARRVMEDLGQ